MKHPRWWTFFLPLLAFAACEREPQHAPAPGLYLYTAHHPIPETTDSVVLSGMLELSRASDRAIDGTWQVEQLHPELVRGDWSDSLEAYVAVAFPSYTGTAVHWVRRTGGPTELGCAGEYTFMSNGVEGSVPLSCSLVWQGEVGTVPRAQRPRPNPVVRPADSVPALPERVTPSP